MHIIAVFVNESFLMPLTIYLYCSLISFSSLYGCYYLKAQVNYILGALLFVGFAWIICIDYYFGFQIFVFKLSLTIGLICAGFWHIIESRNMVAAFLTTHKDEQGESAEQNQDSSVLFQFDILHVTYIVGGIFYTPLLYMGFKLLRNI